MDLKQLVQNVLDGEESGLVALAVLKEQKTIIDQCIKEVEPTALDEAEKYGEKKFTHKDLEVELRAGKRSFDYKGINAWAVCKAKLSAIEVQAKAAYSAYERGKDLTDEETGEILEVPEVTVGKESIIIKRVS